MSYADTGDDEVDYGEGELGDGAAAVTSFQPVGALSALADDEEMAQEEEYDDLYDDVNIRFFQAPAEVSKQTAAGDGFGMDDDEAYDKKPEVKPPVVSAHFVEKVTEHGALAPPPAAAILNPPLISQEGFKVPKDEPKEIVEQEKGMSISWSRQETNYRYPGQQKEIVPPPVVPVNGKDIEQGRQMQLFLSSSTKEQGDGYKNGLRQGGATAAHQLEKPFSPYKDKAAGAILTSGNGEPASGFAQTGANVQIGGSAAGGFSVGPARAAAVASANPKERGGMDDMPYDRTRATPTGPPRPVQRDLSPNVVDNAFRQPVGNENASRHMIQQPYLGDGSAMLFVGDLHWWTTDAELEAALSEYGRVKNLKFFEERVSGKSKGYSQVEFFDHAAALACKQGMNGKKFHDRPCIVALGNTRSIQQMGYQQEKKTQAQIQAQQEQITARRNSNITGGARGGSSYQERDSGRGYGRMGTGRTGHGQGMGNKAGQVGSGRGRGNYMGKGMGSGGGTVGTGMPYAQGHSGPMGGHQSAMMMHQGMMGQGYDPAFGPMGRGGAAYGGYVMPGPPFSGMVTPFPNLGPGALPGVAPHVNPAFFGRSVAPNGMGMMPGGGMEGPHQGMWGDASLGGWGGEEHDRRARDGSYVEDGGGMDYGYGNEMGHEKSRTSGGWDKETGDWPERRRRDDRDGEWDRERYKEKDRDGYRDQRDREKDREKDEDWDRERPVRTRNKSRMVEEEEDDPRQRSREDDYGKKRRMAERELSSM